MSEVCCNCGNDDGSHLICTDCLVRIPDGSGDE